MLHEFKDIIHAIAEFQNKGVKSVLATVVDLDGSSYRKPGVRMLISESGEMIGAVSGGCVEKEVARRAQLVFETGQSTMMTYDGRYRLGCEGILYILLEQVNFPDSFLKDFEQSMLKREELEVHSYYIKEDNVSGDLGTQVSFDSNKVSSLNSVFDPKRQENLKKFKEHLMPCFQLIIIGGEHDAVQLCKITSLVGWDVNVITSVNDSRDVSDFPGATNVMAQSPEIIDLNSIDDHTAIILMTHNYALDLNYLVAIQNVKCQYVGVLGSVKRRDQLYDELLNYAPNIDHDFFDSLYSPAGLNLGAITPQEIALSILSEILSVYRDSDHKSLREIKTNRSLEQ